MTLPAPNLDDLRFQSDLVDEARKRIAQYCPEWTDYNVSDPGITLIELFAWLTEMMVYRLNRVPEKNYVKFLDLLGMKRRPASSAVVHLTFWLSVPLPISPDNLQEVIIPQGLEVRSTPGQGEEEVVFSVDRPVHITPPFLTQLHKEKEVNRNYLSRLSLETFFPFEPTRPRPGDTFYLGFDPEKDLSGHILRLTFNCDPTEAVGIRREDPPWVWECSLGNGMWEEVPLSTFPDEKDTTGGLNNPTGSLVLYLPVAFRPDAFHGRDAYWIRCRLEQRHPSQGMYSESPRVLGITATTLGATAPASHAQVVQMETLGNSTGDPGQEFTLQHAPILDLQEGETLLVEEYRHGEHVMVPWENVADFSRSTPYDRHFVLDAASGHIQLGPSVRQSNGSVQQYGRVPEHGRSLIFKQYRYGGGSKGNLPVNAIQTMTSSVAFVSRVTNLTRANGGRDQESMEEIKLRTQRELKAHHRAVTAQDYEDIALGYRRYAARVRCITPRGGAMGGAEAGSVKLLVVPAVHEALQAGELSALHLNEEWVKALNENLDRYRILTTHVRISEPEYIGVQVAARIVVDEFSIPEVIASRVDQHLKNLINPILPHPAQEEKDHLLEKGWEGWPFGRNLFVAEVYALIQRVPGVKYVLDVALSTRQVEPRSEGQPGAAPKQPVLMEEKLLRVPEDTLLCSLEHQITVVDLAELEKEQKP